MAFPVQLSEIRKRISSQSQTFLYSTGKTVSHHCTIYITFGKFQIDFHDNRNTTSMMSIKICQFNIHDSEIQYRWPAQ